MLDYAASVLACAVRVFQPMKTYTDTSSWTYGVEHEFGDVDRKIELPEGMRWSKREFDIVSDCGLAIDPSGKAHTIGGEVNTPPSTTVEEQGEFLRVLLHRFPSATINHRHHLHLHISVPGLVDDLVAQKKLLSYVVCNSATVFRAFFSPVRHPAMNSSAWAYQIVDRSVMPEWKQAFCHAARTPRDFKEAHARVRDGRIFYNSMKRYGFNLYSLFKHGTVEMRCLFPTLDPTEVIGSLTFFRKFLFEALRGGPAVRDWLVPGEYRTPKQPPFSLRLETIWQETNFKK